ncbi:hypothetical protein PV797_06135 [Clostridiaceae bacterium M8S5]|nr:hypothetical protein PV797_06135 [Clostridiaceae bacterium M8S5]
MICPMCNGVKELVVNCDVCGRKMIDKGRVVDYMDNYSPYLSSSITELVDGASCEECMHLFTCKSCNIDKQVAINKIKI